MATSYRDDTPMDIPSSEPYLEVATASSSNGTAGGVHHNPWLQLYFTPIFYSLISLIGCFGNGLVIAVLVTFKNMRTIPNIYILNLAIVDFVFLLILPFIAYQIATSNWPLGNFLCKVLGGIDGLNQFASIYTLALMSADRYVAVVYPLSSMRYRTKKVARVLCVGIWILSTSFSLPLWIFQKSKPFYVNGTVFAHYCTIILPTWEHAALTYTLYSFLAGFIMPLIIIVVCYMTLMMKIFSSTQPTSNAESAAQRAQKRISILVVSVIVAFVVCWLPYYVVQIVHLTKDMTHALSVLYTLSICLCYINSCFNPFMYTFIGDNFKRNMLKLLRCERDKGRTKSFTGGTYRLHSVTNETGTGHASGNTAVSESTAFIEKSHQTHSTLNSISSENA